MILTVYLLKRVPAAFRDGTLARDSSTCKGTLVGPLGGLSKRRGSSFGLSPGDRGHGKGWMGGSRADTSCH